MTVNSTPTIGSMSSLASQSSGCKQTKADFQALSTALQSGDLSGAQSAFAQLQKENPRVAQALNSGASSAGATSASGSGSSALQALGSALQSGDLAGAQQALAQVQQNAPTRGGHGHHHHGAPPATADDSATTTQPATGPGSILNTTA